MINYVDLTQEQFENLMAGAGSIGFAFGLIIGIILFAVFWHILRTTYMKNFKMWLLQLPEKEKTDVLDKLDECEKILNELSKSNTRFFKSYYNELGELKRHIKRKWMQS